MLNDFGTMICLIRCVLRVGPQEDDPGLGKVDFVTSNFEMLLSLLYARLCPLINLLAYVYIYFAIAAAFVEYFGGTLHH